MDISSLAPALAIGLGAVGPGIAIGLIGAAACRGMARNPKVAPTIQITAIITIAFAEAVAIYALAVALAIKFAT